MKKAEATFLYADYNRNDKAIVGCNCDDWEIVLCVLGDIRVVPLLGIEDCWRNCILIWKLIIPNFNDTTLRTCLYSFSKYRYIYKT